MARPTTDTLIGATTPSTHGLVLAAGRPGEVVAFEAQVVDFFVDAAEMLGVPKSVAAIYGIVFASPVPLSFAEIEARLDISKGSISQGLRVLRDVGALKEVSSDADRAELFDPDMEIRKLIQHFLEQRVQRQLNAGHEQLTVLSRLVPGGRSHDAGLLRARLKHLQGSHEKARALLPLIRTFLKLGG